MENALAARGGWRSIDPQIFAKTAARGKTRGLWRKQYAADSEPRPPSSVK
jgi:hypothetical protein